VANRIEKKIDRVAGPVVERPDSDGWGVFTTFTHASQERGVSMGYGGTESKGILSKKVYVCAKLNIVLPRMEVVERKNKIIQNPEYTGRPYKVPNIPYQ